MEIANRITVDEKIRFGKPVIKGTRVPVDLILGKLAGGMTYEEVMTEYDLTREVQKTMSKPFSFFCNGKLTPKTGLLVYL
jgi:hypothetical protein